MVTIIGAQLSPRIHRRFGQYKVRFTPNRRHHGDGHGLPHSSKGIPDSLTTDDVKAVLRQVRGLLQLPRYCDCNSGRSRREQHIPVLGVTPEYKPVRNLRLISGRFLDGEDLALATK